MDASAHAYNAGPQLGNGPAQGDNLMLRMGVVSCGASSCCAQVRRRLPADDHYDGPEDENCIPALFIMVRRLKQSMIIMIGNARNLTMFQIL